MIAWHWLPPQTKHNNLEPTHCRWPPGVSRPTILGRGAQGRCLVLTASRDKKRRRRQRRGKWNRPLLVSRATGDLHSRAAPCYCLTSRQTANAICHGMGDTDELKGRPGRTQKHAACSVDATLLTCCIHIKAASCVPPLMCPPGVCPLCVMVCCGGRRLYRLLWWLLCNCPDLPVEMDDGAAGAVLAGWGHQHTHAGGRVKVFKLHHTALLKVNHLMSMS